MSYFYPNLKKIDLFGQPIEFCLNKKYFHKSVFGGVLTVIIFGLFSAIAIQGFIDLVNKNEITSSTTMLSNTDPPFIDLNPIKFNWAITLTPTIGIVGVKEYFKIELVQGVYSRDILGNFVKNKIVRKLEPCTLDHFSKVIQTPVLGLASNLSLLLCPNKNDNYFIEGKFSSANFSFMNIRISKCMNTTNKSICASKTEIDDYYKKNGNKIYLNFYILNNMINVNNFEQTVSSFLDDRIAIIIDRKFYKETNFYLTSNDVYTDSSIYRTLYEKEVTTYTFDNDFDEFFYDNSENMNSNDTLYASIYIRSNFISKEHKRTFLKVGKYIGIIGGFWSILFTVFGRVAQKYNKRRLLIKLSNALYQFNDEVKINNNEKKEDKSFNQMKKNNKIGTTRKVYLNSQKINSNSFLSRIKNYLIDSRGIKILKDIKYAFPNWLINILYKKVENFDFNKQKKFFEKAKNAILKDIDILHLLTKIKEIDKLISVLFNENQKTCFEFIPKTVINLNNNKHLEYSRSSLEYSRKSEIAKTEVFNFKSKDYLRLYNSFLSVNNFRGKDNLEERILKCFDKKLTDIFLDESHKEQNFTSTLNDDKYFLMKKITSEKTDKELVGDNSKFTLTKK